MMTDQGPIGLVGITQENVLRMRAGMPLDIHLKDITPPGTRINRVVISLSEDHEHMIDEMAEAGLPVNDKLREHAQELDKELKRERRRQGR
jgi:hypothetical protein